jgi:hypothetical protein
MPSAQKKAKLRPMSRVLIALVVLASFLASLGGFGFHTGG